MSDGGRILVVDDVAPNVRLLEAVLVPRGYDVVSATDGASALELVVSAKPDLVMLDVVMPQPDGYAVCRAIREREDTAMLPVIMITASTSERTEAIRAGADDLIAKPFDQDELLARVRSLLRIKRFHDTITSQAAELTELNRTLEDRVEARSWSSSGFRSSGGSSLRSSSMRSSHRVTIRSSVAIAARSRCSSPTSGDGPASSTRSSPRS